MVAKHSFSADAVLQSGDVFHKTAAAIAGVLPQARLCKSKPRQFRLRDLIEGVSSVTEEASLDGMQLFSVAREIIKHSADFKLHLPDGVENFSELPEGYLLAEDVAGTRWIVEEQGARIIFPNPKVKNGLRAGILVVPATL